MTSGVPRAGRGRFSVPRYQADERLNGEPVPLPQSTFEDVDERRARKDEYQLWKRARQEGLDRKHRLSWEYDEAEYRSHLVDGTVEVDVPSLYRKFESWYNDASVVTLRDLATGETVRKLSPKRGNPAYARLQRKRTVQLAEGLRGLSFSEPLQLGRDNYIRSCALFITLTYDHEAISCQEAWHRLSYDVAKFKVQFKRVSGSAHIQSIRVNEGSESGYPSPHVFVILDAPLTCFKHSGHKGTTYRLHSYAMLQRIKSAWRRGWADVQAVHNGRVSDGNRSLPLPNYLFKYLTKSLRALKEGEPYGTAFKTFAWQKLFRLHFFHLSSGFKCLMNSVRLDTLLSKSQQVIPAYWYFIGAERCKLSEYLQIIGSLPPPKVEKWPALPISSLVPPASVIAPASVPSFIPAEASYAEQCDALAWADLHG